MLSRSTPSLSAALLEPPPPTRVLLVDDAEYIHEVVEATLSRGPYTLRKAWNGAQGLEVWEAWHPHVILMDGQMPQMGGEEATFRIRATEGERGRDPVLIVGISGSIPALDEDRLLRMGFDALLPKPFGYRELLNLLEGLMARRAWVLEPMPGVSSKEPPAFC